ncbi:hypothetical protein Ancab_010950 [Ancistrocladus abbreviatus]
MEEFFKWVTGELGVFMAADSNTRDRRCLEFARILLHTSCMSMINSKLKIRVDHDVVPVWVAEDVSLFDGYDALSGINERHSMFSTSSSYVADSMSGQKPMGNRATATIAVENCPTVVHQREEDVAADLSIYLQRGFRAVDEGASMGFSREIFELGDGCINGSINDNKQGAPSSLLVIPDSGSNQEETREQVGPLMMGRLVESRGLNIKQKKAYLMQAEKDKRESSDSSKSPGTEWEAGGQGDSQEGRRLSGENYRHTQQNMRRL